MKTVESLRESTLSSGFSHVGYDSKTTSPRPYHGQLYGGTDDKAGHSWQGPPRRTAEDAANDVVRQLAGLPLRPMTIEDLRNPKRKSGFDYVRFANTDGRNPGRPYQAQKRIGPGNGPSAWWASSRCATAEEAAQDFCDYVNGASNPSVTASPVKPKRKLTGAPRLKKAVHGKLLTDAEYDLLDEEEKELLKTINGARKDARDKLPHFVYLIGEADTDYVKIGVAGRPDKRIGGLQTANPRPLVLRATIKCDTKQQAVETERKLHAKYIRYNVMREWFKFHPGMTSDFTTIQHVAEGGAQSKEDTIA